MRLLSVLALAACLSLVACGSDDLPTCVETKLSTFRNEACSGGNLVQFTFRSQTVYCFNWGSCQPEKTIEIWEEDCGLLCELGGVGDFTICDGTPWDGNAVEVETLFTQP